MNPLAHSAPPNSARGPQGYADHVRRVEQRAVEFAERLLRHAADPPPGLLQAVRSAARWHDLGKLAPANQVALRKGRNERMPKEWDHIDAGVAHLVSGVPQAVDDWAAWLVRAHHAPGLPQAAGEAEMDFPLRGFRTNRQLDSDLHKELIGRVDACLPKIVRDHEAVVGAAASCPATAAHGLAMRLALSCLVDSDHEDSAAHDRGSFPPVPPEPRWAERLAALDRYVANLPVEGDPNRLRRRAEFYAECREASPDAPLVACEGPVGIGKTTAILAHLLRQASTADFPPRHILIVAPFTNIVSQTVGRLRTALTLSGEQPEDVIAEHHHRADFSSLAARELATLWKAPVIVTTAVQLFESLGGNRPATLRKLHELPGSWVFLDEAHAALPLRMWPQAWLWSRELTGRWGCRFVLASGSLIKFWELEKIDRTRPKLPVLAPTTVTEATVVESSRVRYQRLPEPFNLNDLCVRITAEKAGPRLVILNTVQSAAAIARQLRNDGLDVLHLSTALCPKDRERILKSVEDRLAEERRGQSRDWTLVATSCVEAGVDLSFRNAFREACSVASLIQVGGRTNRHDEYEIGTVYSFTTVPGGPLTCHPEFKMSAQILNDFFKTGRLDSPDPAAVVTLAMETELKSKCDDFSRLLLKAERAQDYPKVADLSRVIMTDTRLVVVDENLKKRMTDRDDRVSNRDLLRGSVQMWTKNIADLGMEPLSHMPDIYLWGGKYDSKLLGYMAEVLDLSACLAGEPMIA